MYRNLILMPKLRRDKVKVKVVSSKGFVLDFDSIRDAEEQLRPGWRENAIVAYAKDKMGKTSEYLFVPPPNNN